MQDYLKKKWKTVECDTPDSGCVQIVTVDTGDSYTHIVSINKESAEHIVKLHNIHVDKCKLDADTKFRISLNNAKTIK
jgi:hypothetical protein